MRWYDTFRWASHGVLRSLRTERNLRIHWISATAVMLVMMALPLSLPARLSLWLASGAVVSAELVNTAVEQLVDGLSRQRTAWARATKDAAAGAVFVLAVVAVALLVTVLIAEWTVVEASGQRVQTTVIWGLPLLVVLAWILFGGLPPLLTGLASLALTGLCAVLVRGSVDPVAAAGAALLSGTAMLSRIPLGRD